MPNSDEEQVALTDPYLLGILGPGEVVRRHVFARLEPGLPAQPRNVQQHAAADDAVAGHVDRQFGRARRGDAVAVTSLYSRPIDHVAKGVDVTVRVAVHVHCQPVHGERQTGAVGPFGGRTGHLVDARIGLSAVT